MIAIIGGPSKEEDKDKKPGFSVGLKIKPKKLDGIGGDYAKGDEEEEGEGMDNEEKKLEAVRPLARAMGVSASVVVDCFTTLFNILETEPHKENTEGREAEGEEGE